MQIKKSQLYCTFWAAPWTGETNVY